MGNQLVARLGLTEKTEQSTVLMLNAGCGITNIGDVRTDIERYSNRYKKPTSANVIADVQYLPFKDGAFEKARCFHVLEHVPDPNKAIKELRRTSKVCVCRVPIWHFYSFFIEGIGTVSVFFTERRIRVIAMVVDNFLRLRSRYIEHLWYIKPLNPKINYFRPALFGKVIRIPMEYEFIEHGPR